MTVKRINYLLTCVLLFVAWNTSAHEQETLFNEVQLYANVEREIPNEEMLVVLVSEHEGSNPSEIADDVNRDMEWALEQANSYKEVDSRTMSYNTSPVYRDRYIIAWRASQVLQLKSLKIDDLTKLTGELQSRLQVRQMSFSPSRETRKRHESELIELAMEEFNRKVSIIQKHMDDMDYRIIRINISANDQPGPRYAYAERSFGVVSEPSMAPAVDAGTSKIIVTVNGSVQFY